MVDLFVAAVALIVLAVVVIAMARGSRRIPVGAGLAVIVLAAGTFAVTLYRSQDNGSAGSARVVSVLEPHASTPGPVGEQRLGGALTRVEVPLGSGDKLPQGALDLAPPRAGATPYTGDVSLLCSTPGRAETEQNCSGDQRRDWVAAPIDHHAQVAAAIGDPFADPEACVERTGMRYRDEYVRLTVGRGYCLRQTGPAGAVIGLRILDFPAERPRPVKIFVETIVLG